jgi:hypothetical protein|tara:strand:- start:545 stop:1054 length:510 start_codon:yes stop_codon:yes gene_type:complete
MTDPEDLQKSWRALQRGDEDAVEGLYDAAGPKDLPKHLDDAILETVHDALSWWQVRWPVATAAVVVLALTLMIPRGPNPNVSGAVSRFETALFFPDSGQALTTQRRTEAVNLITAFINSGMDERAFRESWRQLSASGPPVDLNDILAELAVSADEFASVHAALRSERGI